MRPLIALLLIPWWAHAVSLAFIHDGEQFNLNGLTLVQAADQPNDFYILPILYRIKPSAYYDKAARRYVTDPGVVHTVEDIQGQKVSSYNFRFALRSPTPLELMNANLQLEMTRKGATIKGLAPVCGMTLSVPGFSPEDPPGERFNPSAVDPQATLVQYMINSTETGKCNSILFTPELNVVYRVPLSKEPMIAKSLVSGTGVPLPPVTLILPYKFQDKFSIRLNKKATLKQMKGLIDFTGTIKMVTGHVRAGISSLIKNLEISSEFKIDCKSPPEICAKYMEYAMGMIEKRLVTYTPIPEKGGDLVIADQDKGASLFKIGLAFDQHSVKDEEEFIFDFSNTTYSFVTSQAQFRAAKVPADVLHKEVRDLLGPRP